MAAEDLGWRPVVASWLARRAGEAAAAAGGGDTAAGKAAAKEAGKVTALVARLVEQHLDAALDHKRRHCCELVAVDALTSVRAFIKLFDALAAGGAAADGAAAGGGSRHSSSSSQDDDAVFGDQQDARASARDGDTDGDADGGGGGKEKKAAADLAAVVDLWFAFALTWGLAGTLDEDGRKQFDPFMRWAAASREASTAAVVVCTKSSCLGALSLTQPSLSLASPPPKK